MTSFSKSRNFQIHRVRQYFSGKFYFELWQSNELLRAAIFMNHPFPPHFLTFIENLLIWRRPLEILFLGYFLHFAEKVIQRLCVGYM